MIFDPFIQLYQAMKGPDPLSLAPPLSFIEILFITLHASMTAWIIYKMARAIYRAFKYIHSFVHPAPQPDKRNLLSRTRAIYDDKLLANNELQMKSTSPSVTQQVGRIPMYLIPRGGSITIRGETL